MPPSAIPRLKTDVILPMTREYMDQIVAGTKNYEFRRYRLQKDVKRVWFYLNAPLSQILYVCEIDPARTRNSGDEKLVEDGLGNKEFNDRHPDWERYDYAYRIKSVYKIVPPVTLVSLKQRYSTVAPRGMVYLPVQLGRDIPWREQTRLLPKTSLSSATPQDANADA